MRSLFLQSAVLPERSDLNEVMHPGAPITMLLCQAIELYVRAFLRLKERRVQDLGPLRRGYNPLWKRGMP